MITLFLFRCVDSMKNQEKSNTYPIRTSDQMKYLKSILNDSQFKISIIIPVYNVENYIKNALDSIVRQTIGLKHLEVIMVNDCSTDKSGKIMDEYANKYKNFTSIHLHENSGAAGRPRNVGIENSTGNYLMFLDPDDYYTEDACEVLYGRIVADNVDIVFSRYVYVFENKIQRCHSIFGDLDEIKVKKIDEEPGLFTIPPSVWTKIFKRSFIVENDIRFPEGIPAQDLTFVVHSFLEANGIVYLNNRFLFNYNRIRDSKGDKGISRNKNKKNLMGMIQAYHKTFDLLKNYGKEEFYPTLFKGHLQFWMDGFIISNTSSIEKRELLETIGFLIEEFNKYDTELNKRYMTLLFNNIADKRYYDAISLSEIIKNFIETQNKLEKEKDDLQRILDSSKNELAEHLTFTGYIKYKSKNIAFRINKRFKWNIKSLYIKLKNFFVNTKDRIFKLYIQLQGFNPSIRYDDLTLILPYRKTNDPDREENLDITLNFFSKIGINNMIISEHSDKSSKDYLIKKYAHLFNSFRVCTVFANGQLFNKSRAINKGVLESLTQYVAIVDVDCITKKENVNRAIKLLKKGYKVVHPFDRKVTDIIDKKTFQKKFDFHTIKTTVQNRPWADGGIVFWDKNSFINIGMENENFSGWGGEDNEIMIRADLFNLKQYRIDDTLYHLYHHRPQKRTQNNVEQLQKTRQMTKELCLDEINRWPWVIEAKKRLC
ncbi:glycosyl transferase GT2 family [Methanobacterium formicicum]|uniref:Glycosyl transferase GT2 family n=2 Tax=Methanobacterium formicicum TaxID=2162 RepID=A0A089Z9N8_METFO|nr:glycosyl transferase GT2 family [Methanobacterium formicicum]